MRSPRGLAILTVLVVASCVTDGPMTPERAIAPGPPQSGHYRSARAAVLEGDLDEARLEARLSLQDDPLDARSHFLLGCLLEPSGESDQAIVAFERAVELDPTHPEALYNLGTLLLRRGEVLRASYRLEDAVDLRPDHLPSLNNLAKAYFEAGLPELAVGAYEEVLRRDPSNAVALGNLLLLADAAGLADAADAYRRRLAARESGRADSPAVDATAASVSPTWPLAVPTAPSTAVSPSSSREDLEPRPRPDPEAEALRELLVDLPHVSVERRGGRLTLTGWTSGPIERAILDRILGAPPAVLDLTTDDAGDPQRMLEIDAVLFIVSGLDSESVGFNFLEAVNLNFNYFASDNDRAGFGFQAPPSVTGPVNGLTQEGWIFGASVDYVVDIANASEDRVAVLARPHLTTLSGTPANFLAGGEIVFEVTGNIGGDIKPYPFGTTLEVSPTLLRTPAPDGTPRVHLKVDAGRLSVLSLVNTRVTGDPTNFEKVQVSSEAVLNLGQTLILSGLSQRESRTGRGGVPVLRDIPILKYLFSTETTVVADVAVVILLTPRDPAFFDEQNEKALAEFVDKRRAFLAAERGTPEDMRRFRERYPDWQQIAPNRFASHFFLLESSEIYRAVSGQDVTSEDLDLSLLGPSRGE